MKGYRIAKPGDYQSLATKLKGGEPSEVLIYRPETKVNHPLLCFVQGPFEAFKDKLSCYSKNGPQQTLSLAKKFPYEIRIGESPIQGGPYQLLIKK